MMLQWLILLTLFVHNSLAFGLYDDIDETNCAMKTKSGDCCVFPFNYKNKTYQSCTKVDNGNTLWCATTSDYDKDWQWGNCKITQEPANCDVETKLGDCCVFPFNYKNKRYQSCTKVDNGNTLWCATTSDYDKDWQWGNCNITLETANCEVETKLGDCCVFPFNYENKTYHSCTKVDNGNTLWCATTSDYDKDWLWGNCKITQGSNDGRNPKNYDEERTGDYDLWPRGIPSPQTTAPHYNSDCVKDILILWDNSASVGYGSFKDKVVPFLINLVKNTKLNVGERGTHLGFITFSSEDKTKTLLKFGDITKRDDYVKWLMSYKSDDYDKQKYEQDLMGYLTYTGKAFELANENFTETSPFNYRKEVEDVIFLFTDGEPNTGKRDLTRKQKQMAYNYSKILREDKKVKIIGLAVGREDVLKNFNQTIIDLSSKPEKKNQKYYFQTSLTKKDLNKIVGQLVGPLCIPAGNCLCKGIIERTVYTKKGRNAIAEWPEPTLKCANQPSSYEIKVSPKGSKSGQAFPEGLRKIIYSFTYNDGATRKTKDCIVSINVTAGCECPTQQVNGVIGPSETEGLAEWIIPEPTCPARLTSPPYYDEIPKSDSGRFTEGNHTIQYIYTHTQNSNTFDIICDINIKMQACKCPTTQTVNAQVKPGDTRALVGWTKPTPDCTTTPSASNPQSTSGWFSVGQRKLTYKYKYTHANKQESFDIECYVNIVVTGEFCGKTTYDPANQVCCCGKIHNKKSGYQCCGLEYYNTRRETCCDSERAILMPRGQCPVKN